MRNLLFGLLCAAAMWSCGSGSRFTVTIYAPEDVAGVRLAKSEMGLPDIIELKYDAENNIYTGKGRIQEPEMAMIVDGDDEPLAVICVEEGDIVVRYDDEAFEYVASGTPSNDAVTKYRPQLMAMIAEWEEQNIAPTEEEQEAFFERFYAKINEVIDENNDNLYGVSLFATSGMMLLEPEEILARIEKFPKHLQKSKLLEPAREYAEAAIRSSVGSHFTEIVAPDAEGIDIALSSVVGEGKWVLVDFWATWCGPCRGELPYLKAAYEKYADKGFVIYGVSLDNDSEGWAQFVDDNGMDWINVLDIREDKSSPAADAYGIQTIPSNFLIAPDGEIVATNLRGEEVVAALSEILE